MTKLEALTTAKEKLQEAARLFAALDRFDLAEQCAATRKKAGAITESELGGGCHLHQLTEGEQG